jgi:hypothetical protein
MFIGHFAVGFAAKRVAPAVSLGMLFLAAQLADLVWPHLVLLGVEHLEIDPGNTAVTPLRFVFYPYSHSLVAMTGWGVAAAVLYALVRPVGLRGGVAILLVVVSHWVLDVVSHRPDMPMTVGGDPRFGFGLWNSVWGTVVVEALLLAAGLAVYVRVTRARDRTGSRALWALVGVLVLINVANLAGPPPPSAAAVAWTARAMWLLVLWGFWVDRHRERRPSSSGANGEIRLVRGQAG